MEDTTGRWKFIELTDGTIVNSYDIILLNVDTGEDGEKAYKLYLRGKKMTLALTKDDYDIIRNFLCG